jgi:hypothetical protein
MNYNAFFAEVRRSGVELAFDNPETAQPARLSNEALFHLPLLAITILLLSKDKRKPKVNQIGQLVGECFERTFVGFKGSSQHLGWSANLRVRTVRALTFLETAGLIVVASSRLGITDKGKKVIQQAFSDEHSDLYFNLRLIERAYRDISVERQLSLSLG